MRKSETHRRLVHLILVHFKCIIKDKESGKVLLIGLDARSKYLKIIQFRCQFRCYGTNTIETLDSYFSCTFCSIFRLYKTYPWIILEEFACLVYGHVVSTDFLDVFYPLTR